eukprot:TRINITY_DN2278_c0_g3_i1.p1 TRINITY_DN2278_c0_g3~~TRINITY_DN2278_c0_g3_i1.p1  ORF type:complete len:253 (-),score=49.94 TRINITY_DN2278_c0_g3_i1:258-950(-)
MALSCFGGLQTSQSLHGSAEKRLFSGTLPLKGHGYAKAAHESERFSFHTTLIAAALIAPALYCGRKFRVRRRHIRQVQSPGGEAPPPSLSLPTAPARAARVTAVYLGVIGAALLVAPVATFSLLFEAKEITGPWIRVYGALCVLLAWYYEGAATGGDRGFLKATVSGRFALAGALVVLSVTGGARWLLLLAAMNAAGAISMRRALTEEAATKQKGAPTLPTAPTAPTAPK